MNYFPESTAIKRVRCVKFTDSYDNSPLTKQDRIKIQSCRDYICSTHDEPLEDNFNTKGKGANKIISNLTEKKTQFFLLLKTLKLVGLTTVV